MSFPSDLEIAKQYKIEPIQNIAAKLNIDPKYLISYGPNIAKVKMNSIRNSGREDGKLVLVTAITPTPAGEGKTTTSIGLAQGLQRIQQKVSVALREPSMGPLFGVKGGAAGGGYAQVVPMEQINMHFTGDFAAITAAHNLLSAAIDNALHHNQLPELDPRLVTFPRVLDVNDRALRHIVIGLGGKTMGIPRQAHFDITAASEIMAILCLSKNYSDLKERLGNIMIGQSYSGKAMTASDLKVSGAMAAILKDAIHPNLVQTIEGVPAFIHGGPFANIAHGANSILATKMALAYSDITITEAGFGGDLGAEKFFNITSRVGEFAPQACVIVATIRALKIHGGIALTDINEPNTAAVKKGLSNLNKHLENISLYKTPTIVAINKFQTDTDEEIQVIIDHLTKQNIEYSLCEHFVKGGKGTIDLAEKVVKMLDSPQRNLNPLYELKSSIKSKVEAIAKTMYGASSVEYSTKAVKTLKQIENLGLENLAVCMAKTPKSLSDNPKLIGRPTNFEVSVRDIEIARGAGFIIPITGTVMRMPGLPKKPAYENIDIDENGVITGLS